MEELYGWKITYLVLEWICMNRLIDLTEDGRGLSYDKVNELGNL